MPDKSGQFRRDVGERLRLLREARDFKKQRHFAEAIDVPEATYTKWEKGKALIPPDVILILKRRYGISADWIYFGDESGLPPLLVKQMSDVARVA